MENKTLVLDLVEWIARKPRPYEEVMESWRTSCPRFPIWEDAIDQGLIAKVCENGCVVVQVTPAGRAFLSAERP